MARQNDPGDSGQGSRGGAIILALIGAASTILVGYWQFGPSKAHEQAIGQKHFTGRVIDTSNGERVQGAKVSLETEGVPPVLYTDSEGIFSFTMANAQKNVRLIIEARGYKTYERRLDDGASSEIQDIRLTPIAISGPPSSASSAIDATITSPHLQKPSDGGSASVPEQKDNITASSRVKDSRIEKILGVWQGGGYTDRNPEFDNLITHQYKIHPKTRDTVIFSFAVPRAGRYLLTSSYASDEPRPVSMLLDCNSPSCTPIFQDRMSQLTGGPREVKSFAEGTLELQKGSHQIIVFRDGFIPHIKGLSLTWEK
jgi:hypothetical protein